MRTLTVDCGALMKEQILLVEDDPDAAELMQMELECLGYEARVAVQLEKAISVLKPLFQLAPRFECG